MIPIILAAGVPTAAGFVLLSAAQRELEAAESRLLDPHPTVWTVMALGWLLAVGPSVLAVLWSLTV